MKKVVKEHYKTIIGIILIAIVIIGYVYQVDTLRSHDLSFHIANIKNIMDNHLKVNPIMPAIGNNLGYGIYIFYPCLPHFVYALLASLLGIFKLSLVDRILIINILVSILSSIILYFLSFKLSKNKTVAFLSAIIYLLFPYRFGTITIRMALNENFTSIFMPLILLGVSYLLDENFNKKKFYIYFVLGYTGLILSHYVLALFFTIFLLIILLWNIKKLKERFIPFFKAVIIVSILVLPNIVILLEHYKMKYLVFSDNYVTSKRLIEKNILSLKDLVIFKNKYDWEIPFFISLPVIIGFICSSFYVIKNKNKKYIVMSFLSILLIYIITSHSLWKILPKTFDMIQFPWRLLLVLSLFVSLVSPMIFQKIKNKILFVVALLALVLPAYSLAIKLQNRRYFDYYNSIHMDDGAGNINEYYPVEFLDNESYYRKKDNIDFISSSGKSSIIENDLSKNILTFSISGIHEANIELPRIYYKGYVLEDKDHHRIKIKKSKRGFIKANVSSSIYTLKYKGPYFYNIARYIRILFIIYLCFKGYKIILKR